MMRVFILTAFAFLSACSGPAPLAAIPPIDFRDVPAINLDVSEVRVVEAYQPPMALPNVEHSFPTPPDVAINRWVTQRLQAVGTSGLLEVTIADASVKETPLQTKDGVTGLFYNEQSERYDARLRAVFKLYDGVRALPVAQGDVTITRLRSLAENATAYERDLLFDAMLRDMMQQFDTEAKRRLQQYFSAYLR